MQSEIKDQEYFQVQNSYLSGLPELVPLSIKSEANLKLLHYWERNIIPGTLEFCKDNFRDWEFEHYFG